jgi:hypothetical protein
MHNPQYRKRMGLKWKCVILYTKELDTFTPKKWTWVVYTVEIYKNTCITHFKCVFIGLHMNRKTNIRIKWDLPAAFSENSFSLILFLSTGASISRHFNIPIN